MDLYDILNINKDSTEIEIKKAYKKMAFKYHPDKNAGNKDCEEKFKNISMAYQILSDNNKREIYDLTGSTDYEDTEFNPADMFNNIFTMFGEHGANMGENIIFCNVGSNLGNLNEITNQLFTSSQQQVIILKEKTKDIYYNCHVSLEDIYNNKTKHISINHIRYDNNNGKYVKTKKNLSIPVNEREIVYENEADEEEGYEKAGDVIINIIDKPHPIFKRYNEYDLIMTHHISPIEIYSGFNFEFKHLNGKFYQISMYPKYIQNNKDLLFKIPNLGLYDNKDLYVQFSVQFPKLNKIELDKLKELNIFQPFNNKLKKIKKNNNKEYLEFKLKKNNI